MAQYHPGHIASQVLLVDTDGNATGVSGNPLVTSGGGGPGGDTLVTDIEDGAGQSIMDAALNAAQVKIVGGSGAGVGITGINYTDAANRDIDVGGNSQEVFPANANRTGLILQNISDEDLWVDFDQAATLDTPSIRLIGGGLGILQFPDASGRIELGQVTINGATAGQKFVAKEAEDA